MWERAWRDGEGTRRVSIYSRSRRYTGVSGRARPCGMRRERSRSGSAPARYRRTKQMEEKLAILSREREHDGGVSTPPSSPERRAGPAIIGSPIRGGCSARRSGAQRGGAHGACVCIIDITGARIIDSHAIANLSNLVSALRLIGTRAIVTGISAHAAQSLVELGLDLKGMRTHRTLAEALAELIKTSQRTKHRG